MHDIEFSLAVGFLTNGRTSLIPKIIHQTAMADKSRWHPSWERFQKSWLSNFPDFEYRFWADEDLDELIRSKNECFYESYKSYDANIKKVDASRYFILHEFGGIYADMDFECVKNFWDKLPQEKISFAESGGISVCRIENALMISPKGHKFWDFLFTKLEDAKNKSVFEATGPIFLDKCIKQYLGTDDFLNILPRNQFSLGGDNKCAIHHQTGVWTLPKKTKSDSIAYEGVSDWDARVETQIFEDAFYIAIFKDKVTVIRKDKECGWGQDLNLVLREKSSGEERILNIGPSTSFFKSVSFD